MRRVVRRVNLSPPKPLDPVPNNKDEYAKKANNDGAGDVRRFHGTQSALNVMRISVTNNMRSVNKFVNIGENSYKLTINLCTDLTNTTSLMLLGFVQP